MAEQAASPQVLRWGRRPDGLFQIEVCVQVPNGLQNGQHQFMIVPIHTFVLSADEEAKLKERLTGLHIINKLPEG